jgi:hypothetical protein
MRSSKDVARDIVEAHDAYMIKVDDRKDPSREQQRVQDLLGYHVNLIIAALSVADIPSDANEQIVDEVRKVRYG